MDRTENRTFDEILLGDTASLTHTVRREELSLFAAMSSDVHPPSVDGEFARGDLFQKTIAHDLWGASLISTILHTKFPGTTYLRQALDFHTPVVTGDTITTIVTAIEREKEQQSITFDCTCINQQGEVVISGETTVRAPDEKIRRPQAILPEAHAHKHGTWYQQVLDLASGLEPLCTAIVHPVESNAFLGAIEAAQSGLIVPILIGPIGKIEAIAQAHAVDLSPYTVLPTEHSHEAAEKAVELARAGKVAAIMKGSLHTDELMHAVLAPGLGLQTERRMSHVFILDVPAYPRPLFITDAALNIAPDLTVKRDIVQNAIDLAHVLGINPPRVAILSAVETVNPRIPSTLDAAALCKMADRGQISGGIVDGPLAFDNAVSLEAARTKGILSPVAGRADILVVPDLEAGNMLSKQLEYLADAQTSGIVLGARVPIILTSRSDTPLAHKASCVLALLQHHAQRRAKP